MPSENGPNHKVPIGPWAEEMHTESPTRSGCCDLKSAAPVTQSDLRDSTDVHGVARNPLPCSRNLKPDGLLWPPAGLAAVVYRFNTCTQRSLASLRDFRRGVCSHRAIKYFRIFLWWWASQHQQSLAAARTVSRRTVPFFAEAAGQPLEASRPCEPECDEDVFLRATTELGPALGVNLSMVSSGSRPPTG